jgi:hypothetical protein
MAAGSGWLGSVQSYRPVILHRSRDAIPDPCIIRHPLHNGRTVVSVWPQRWDLACLWAWKPSISLVLSCREQSRVEQSRAEQSRAGGLRTNLQARSLEPRPNKLQRV